MHFLNSTRKRLQEPKGVLSLLLLLQTILRIPNFSDPYWYGDEGIYLTIGNALRQSGKLYTTIVDHKTPLIYYLAMVQDQIQFRILLYCMMLLATIAFFNICRTLFGRLKPAALATFAFVLFTSLPWFEGHIPNGELFVISFVLYGAWALIKTPVVRSLFLQKSEQKRTMSQRTENWYLFFGGISFGLALLTKVPALFDIVAFGLIFVFLAWRERFEHFPKRVVSAAIFGFGCLLPVLLSVLYFYAIGSGSDYLSFGLLYNFKYAGSWQLSFTNPILLFLFTLAGKAIVLFGVLGTLLLLSKKLSATTQFALAWFWLALFASLLSNRPYPHYFLQVIPPAALLLGLFMSKPAKKMLQHIQVIFLGTSLAIFCAVLILLNVGLYKTSSYYKNWHAFVTKKISKQEYFLTFDQLMTDNYAAAQLITTTRTKPSLFIWGTNPMLYALTKAVPPTRFTVSFHIADLQVYDETMQDVLAARPEYIVVMKNESRLLPGLYPLLFDEYTINTQFEHFTLWKRMHNSSGLLY